VYIIKSIKLLDKKGAAALTEENSRGSSP